MTKVTYYIQKSWGILDSMLNRVLILFVLFGIVGSAVSGTPLQPTNEMMMECCDKAKSGDRSEEASIARLCCGLNCSESAPTSPGSTNNFFPSNIKVSQSIAEQIAALFSSEKEQPSKSVKYSRDALPRTFLPRYIQHHSFLI